MKKLYFLLLSSFAFTSLLLAQGNQITQVAAGNNHSLYKCMDNMVYAFGDNVSGQLGIGSIIDAVAPAQVVLTDVVQIAASGSHSLFLKNDGTVWACGWNYAGQLGDSTLIDRNLPVQVYGLNNVVSIAAGQDHSIFIKSDGTAWTCGDNITGQLGNGTTTNSSIPVQVLNVNNAVQASGGTYHSLFLLADSTVMCTGGNFNGQLGTGDLNPHQEAVIIPGLTGVVQVSCGSTHSMFLKADGTVLTCGSNNYGELALQTSVDTIVPAVVSSLSDIVEISAGYNYSLFLKADGTVYGSGLNMYGQLGNGNNTTTGTNAPSQVQNLTNISHIDGGASHSIFVQGNGAVWSTGSNSDGQLGDNATTFGSAFVPVSTIDACVMTAMASHEDEEKMVLYPNPTQHVLTIDIAQIDIKNNLHIVIFDALGSLVYQSALLQSSVVINFETYARGIYYCQLQDAQGNILQKNKLVKE